MNLALIPVIIVLLAVISVLCFYTVRVMDRNTRLKSQKGVLIEALKGYAESNQSLQTRCRQQQTNIVFLLNEMGMDLPPDVQVQIIPTEEY